MSKQYGDWDLFQAVYNGEKGPRDKHDVKARERKEPEKMVIPMTYAQVQTFVAFCFQLFTQRPQMFELTGTGVEDWKAAKVAEACLSRDLVKNKFSVIVYQDLLNIGRFGLGVIKHTWSKETKMQLVDDAPPEQAAPSLSGVPMFGKPQTQSMQPVTKFLGNKLESISPYRFFPDPRVPIGDFQNGEFCADETDVTHIYLRKQEKNGMFAGTKYIKDMKSTEWEVRNTQGMRSGVTFDLATGKQKGGVLMTSVQIDIIPNEFELGDKSFLGTEDYPVKYVIVIANDNRVIKCEPMNYMHDNYTYSVSQLSPDQMRQINAGVAELVQELQSVITWLFNSRITSVRQTIQNRMIVDPEGVEMSDIADRKPVIRLKKGAARSGVDRWVKQIQVSDVTQSHIQDATSLGGIMQVVTGINENALGQYSSGRRSAEQTKAVNSGAASRLKMFAVLIWVQQIAPLGEDMLSNLRDGLDEEQLVKVMGIQSEQPMSQYAVSSRDFQQFLGVTKADLIGNYDFEMLDGTSSTEKGEIAQMLQELLVGLMSNPNAAAMLGLDPRALLTEIAELNGIRNPERFFLQPTQQQQMVQQAQQMNGPSATQAGTQSAPMPSQSPDISQLIGNPAQLPGLSV